MGERVVQDMQIDRCMLVRKENVIKEVNSLILIIKHLQPKYAVKHAIPRCVDYGVCLDAASGPNWFDAD